MLSPVIYIDKSALRYLYYIGVEGFYHTKYIFSVDVVRFTNSNIILLEEGIPYHSFLTPFS